MTDGKTGQLPRLCSEIQLFDLCSLGICRYKNGSFCSNAELLQRFEAIADSDVHTRTRYMDVEADDDTVDSENGFAGDDYAEDEFSDDREDWQDDAD